jgi:hypothetical protein
VKRERFIAPLYFLPFFFYTNGDVLHGLSRNFFFFGRRGGGCSLFHFFLPSRFVSFPLSLSLDLFFVEILDKISKREFFLISTPANEMIHPTRALEASVFNFFIFRILKEKLTTSELADVDRADNTVCYTRSDPCVFSLRFVFHHHPSSAFVTRSARRHISSSSCAQVPHTQGNGEWEIMEKSKRRRRRQAMNNTIYDIINQRAPQPKNIIL